MAKGDREAVVSTFLREVVRMRPGELDVVRRDASWGARLAAAHTIPVELRLADTYQPDFARIATVRVPSLMLLGDALHSSSSRHTACVNGSRPPGLVVMPGQQHVAMNSARPLRQARLEFLD